MPAFSFISNRFRIFSLATGLALSALFPQLDTPSQAGGPLSLSDSGAPRLWSNPGQIPYNPDNGSLGFLGKTQATQFTADSFGKWAAVPTSSVQFANKGTLAQDVTGSNYSNYLSNGSDGKNPIIFDNDGTIVEAIFGEGAKDLIMGFAGPYIRNNQIVEGEAVLNGTLVTNAQEAELFRATLIHEFGHYIGLDHTQINSFVAGNGNAEDDYCLPTMYPTATDNDLELSDLNPDDIAWVSELYPAGGSTLGAIEGKILTSSGGDADGINVIARGAYDPFYDAVSCVTNYRKPATPGAYRIPKLSPGCYTVGIDQIFPDFTNGSSVGPFDPPRELTAPVEYYSGSSESNNSSTDKPDDSLTLNVKSGTKLTGINITLNSGAGARSNITEKESNNSVATAQPLHGSRVISGSISDTDKGDLTLGDPADDFEDLYYLNGLDNAAYVNMRLEPFDKDKDLDLVAFSPTDLGVLAFQSHAASTNNGIEEFGPLDIGMDGVCLGVSYWDDQGAGSTNYTLTIDVVRFPIGIDTLTPSSGLQGKTLTLTLDGSGFASGAKVSFPGSGIKVNSVTYPDPYYLMKISVTIPSGEPAGLKEIKVTNATGQTGRRAKAFEVKAKPSATGGWELYQ